MPDLTITTASVLKGTGATLQDGTAGETITAGMPVYLQASDTKLYKADANDTAKQAVVGIALHNTLANQPLKYQTSGSITIGATLVAGDVYVLSDTAGKICPVRDLMLDGTDYFVPLGFATSSTVLLMNLNSSAAVATAMPGYLTKEAVIDRVVNATVVGTTSVNGDILDMTGYDSVTFIVAFGNITDGTPGLKVQQDTDSGMATAADLATSAVTCTASDDNKLVVEEIVRPTKQYVRCVVTRGGATGAVIDAAIAIRWRTLTIPTTQPADVAAIEQHLTPAEGTA